MVLAKGGLFAKGDVFCEAWLEARKQLLPNVVLLGGEHHRLGEIIADFINEDKAREPDFLPYLVRVLRAHGPKALVWRFAETAKDRGGTVVYVKLSKPPQKAYRSLVDHLITLKCDKWARDPERWKSGFQGWRKRGTGETGATSRNPVGLDRFSNYYIIKYGLNVSLTEGENMLLVRETQPFLVPEVFALYSAINAEGRSVNYHHGKYFRP